MMLAQDLLVASLDTNSILRFDGETGAPLGAFVSSGAGGLVAPQDPTFGPDGNLYVTSNEPGHVKILKFDGSTGASLGTFVNTGVGGLSSASAIEFGPDGNLYVATVSSAGVLRYDGTTGAFLGVAASGNGIRRASGIDFGPDGLLYVLDSDSSLDTFNDRIIRFDPTTDTFVDQFVAPGSLDDGLFFTFGPDNHLYAPDIHSEVVRHFSGDTGESLGRFDESTTARTSPIFAMDFGPDGNAYAAISDRVLRYDGETGAFLDVFVDGIAGGTITFFPAENPPADLDVAITNAPANGFLGEDISVSYSVTNNSSNPTPNDEWVDVIYLSTDEVFDPLDVELGRVTHTGGLAAGSSYTETLTTTQSELLAGDYHILVFTDRRGEVGDSDRLNNVEASATTTTLLPRAEVVSPTQSLAVGRTLSSWTTAGLVGNQLTITYTVYNLTADYVSDVSLQTTLQSGVTFASASQTPVQAGQQLTWSAGLLGPLESFSVDVVVSFPGGIPLQLDDGASATGTINFLEAVADAANPAQLRTDAIDPALLAATVDANSDDIFVRAKAAELNQDANEIFDFMTQEIGYESYVGSLRGARGTLWSAAGNSLDQASLMIGLLRSSGVPAQYLHGELPDSVSKQLIASMFPEPQLITGFIGPGIQVSDPISDVDLLLETRNHFWVQFDDGNGMLNADPSFADAVIGQTFSSTDEVYSVVPDSMRAMVNLSLSYETTTPGLVGGSFQNLAPALTATYSTAELYGKPLSIGFLVQTNTLDSLFTAITNTYSPYLLISGDSLSPSQDEAVRGTDFQDVLTNFPFGSQFITGLFLDIEVIAADGTSTTYTSTIADRIGSAVRANGGSAPAVNGDDPIVTSVDVTTVSIMPGKQSRISISQQIQQLNALSNAFTSQLNSIHAFPTGPERDYMLGAIGQDFVDLLIAASRFRLTQISAGSDVSTAAHEISSLVKAYFDSPRISIVHTTSSLETSPEATITFSVDLAKSDLRTIAYPGQVPAATIGFRINQGISDTLVEQLALGPLLSEGHVVAQTGVQQIFQLASDQNIATLLIMPQTRSQLEGFNISPRAKSLINAALDDGKQVLTPVEMISVNGTPRLAWFEIDPRTGDTIGVFDDGTHGAFVQYAATARTNPAYNPAVQFNFGVLDAIIGDTTIIAIAKFITWVYIGALQSNLRATDPVNVTLIFKNNLTTLLNLYKEFATGLQFTPEFALGFIAGTAVAYKYANDPPVDGFLLSPAPMDELRDLDSQGTPLATKVVFDPLYFITKNDAEVRTVFRLGIKNATSVSQTYQIDFGSVPTGFEGEASVNSITIPAGQTAEVGLALRPVGSTNAPGSDASFDIIVTPVSAPSTANTTQVSFTVPEIRGLVLSANPSIVTTNVATPGTAQFVVTSNANVVQHVNFAADTRSGLSVSGLADITIDPGETIVQTLHLTPSSNQPLNGISQLVIEASFGGQLPQVLQIPVRVGVPGADAIGNAAGAARQFGNQELADRLGDLGISITGVVVEPANEVFQSQTLASLDTLLRLLAIDPLFVSFASPLSTLRDTFAAASNDADILSAVNAIGEIFEDFAAVTSALATGNFTLVLSPNSQIAQPLVPREYSVQIQNVGTQTTTYDFAISGLPPEVTAQFAQTSVTLDRGEFTNVLFTLTQNTTEQLLAFDFSVDVSISGVTPIVSKNVVGSLRTRREIVSVTDVVVTPPFGDAGTEISISAQLLNAVNRQQAVNVYYQIIDPTATEVFTSFANPVTEVLTVQASLENVDLGTFDTTGLADGQYTLVVHVLDADGNAILGATGQSTFLIGSPVNASLAVNPQELPPGTSTVTNTLQIDATDVGGGELLQVLAQLPITNLNNAGLFNQTLSFNGDIAYVLGGGIHSVDVSNPLSPQVIGFRSNGEGRLLSSELVGDTLVTIEAGNGSPVALFANTAISTWNVAGGSATNPIRRDRLTNNYIFGAGLAVDGDAAFMSTLLVGQNLGLGDNTYQNGTVLSFDIADPADVTFLDVLFNENGRNGQAPLFRNGGNNNIFDILIAEPGVLVAGTTTSTGTDTQIGVGQVMFVDVSNPATINSDAPNPSKVINRLDIPGTTQVQQLARDGNLLFALGTEGGWLDPFDPNVPEDIGPTGNIVMATVDISDPQNPQLLHTQVLPRSARGINSLTSLGHGQFAFASLGSLTDDPLLYVIDADDPQDLLVAAQLTTPSVVSGMGVHNGLLYATSTDGLTVYSLGGGNLPATASVRIPNGTGVEVIPGSFNVEPTSIVPGADFDTLIWDLTFDIATPSRNLTWQSTVSQLQPGEVRPVTLDLTVEFVVAGNAGEITVPSQNVFAKQLLSLAPAERTVAPGESASYTVTIANPTTLDVTYDLSVAGVIPEWVDLAPSVMVPAGQSVDVPLTLTSMLFTPPSDYGFVITATVDGVSSFVEGILKLEGEPVLPEVDSQSHGVVLSLSPTQSVAGQGTAATFVARVTNTGSQVDTFDLSVIDLPPDFAVIFSESTIAISPGSSNFRDVVLSIEPPLGTNADTYTFQVIATSTTLTEIGDSAEGVLTVLDLGVNVDIVPDIGDSESTYQMFVTNTGQVTDTFDLSLAAPAALSSTLGITSVTLAPGETQPVPINVGAIDFAFPGPLNLVGVAISRTNQAVRDADLANINIEGTLEMTAAFDQDTMQQLFPGNAQFLLIVENIGNLEDEYTASIVSTSGPISASLNGPDGQPTQTIPLFILPGLSTGVIVLDTEMAAFGEGKVTVQVRSLTDGSIVSQDTATVVSETTGQLRFKEVLDERVWLEASGVSADGIIIFAWGTEVGTTFVPQYGVTLGIANAKLGSLAEGGADGTTSGFIPIPFTPEGRRYFFQAFEIAPNPFITNVLPLNIAGSPIIVSVNNLPPEPTEALPNFTANINGPFKFDISDAPFIDPDSSLPLVYSARQSNGSALPQWLKFDSTNLSFSSDQLPAAGQWSITVTAADHGAPIQSSSTTFLLRVKSGQSVWQNTASICDVNQDGQVTPLDALFIINLLSHGSAGTLANQRTDDDALVDVNGDKLLTPLDALQVINLLNARAIVASESRASFEAAPTIEPLRRVRTTQQVSDPTEAPIELEPPTLRASLPVEPAFRQARASDRTIEDESTSEESREQAIDNFFASLVDSF
ncbi:MAG: dockerin type I domain-containing protein [Pirellulaceae bacterium]